MTRESLRKHYERIMKAFEFTPDREIYQSSKMIIDLLNQTEWIPVTERLPDNGGRYLVNYSSGYVATAYYYELGMKWNSVTVERIIAWMPLPQPYKAESEGEE